MRKSTQSGELPLADVADFDGIAQAAAGLDAEVGEDGMPGVEARNAERLVASAKPPFIDFVGVRRAPVVRRRDFDLGSVALCHAAMIDDGAATSKGSYCDLFTAYSQDGD